MLPYDLLQTIKDMGWFSDKYGEDEHPKMSIDLFGEDVAIDTFDDVQQGKIKEETILKNKAYYIITSYFILKTL